jgi:hypothetical protein
MVTYQNRTWRVQILGTMMSGAEEWSTGFFLGNIGGGDVGTAPTSTDAQTIATLWSTQFTNGSRGFSGNFKTIGTKISLVDTAGHADPANTAYYYYTTPISGGSGGSWFPPQISLVATLTTARVRGYGSKGRMFLPGINFPIDANGKMGSTEATSIKDGMKTFLDGVNTAFSSDYEVVLNSALSAGIPGHPALMEPVTGVRIGNVYDTQRRRRNQLTEQYVAGALA